MRTNSWHAQVKIHFTICALSIFVSMKASSDILDNPKIQTLFTEENSDSEVTSNHEVHLTLGQEGAFRTLGFALEGEPYLGDVLMPEYGISYAESTSDEMQRKWLLHARLRTTTRPFMPVNVFFFTGLRTHLKQPSQRSETAEAKWVFDPELRAGFTLKIRLNSSISMAFTLSRGLALTGASSVWEKASKAQTQESLSEITGGYLFALHL